MEEVRTPMTPKTMASGKKTGIRARLKKRQARQTRERVIMG
jgi:DNA integrity scanning protein DisA with diadenylate cyclase activity